MEKEQWRDVKGYENLYEISNQGRLKSLKYNKIMSPALIWDGKNQIPRYTVNLRRNGKCKCYCLSKVVAEAWVDNPENKPRVYFKDGKCLNCKADNLYWDISSKSGTRGVGILDTKTKQRYKSITQLAKELGVPYRTLWQSITDGTNPRYIRKNY